MTRENRSIRWSAMAQAAIAPIVVPSAQHHGLLSHRHHAGDDDNVKSPCYRTGAHVFPAICRRLVITLNNVHSNVVIGKLRGHHAGKS